MKQKFTTEKNKYLENKNLVNETMFNFKISCLMKKQVISLMMVLAMVILAGTSAMAQNSPTNPEIMFNGATRTYSVTDNSTDPPANTYQWNVFGTTGDGSTTTPYVSDDIDANPGTGDPVYTITGVSTSASLIVTWTEYAGGTYCIQVAESNPADRGGCATIRQIFVTVVEFDLNIFASDATGAPISDGALITCGANGDYNPWFNDMTTNLSTINDASTATPGYGATSYSTRYITAQISSTGIDFSGAAFSWQFPFTIIGGDEDYFIDMVAHTNTSNVTIADTYDAGTVTVGLNEGATITSVVFEIRYDPKWSNSEDDIQLAMNVAQSSCVLDGSDTDTDFDDGQESAGNYSADPASADPLPNQSANQIIRVSPATTTISIAD